LNLDPVVDVNAKEYLYLFNVSISWLSSDLGYFFLVWVMPVGIYLIADYDYRAVAEVRFIF
jgi:hypothetical protein